MKRNAAAMILGTLVAMGLFGTGCSEPIEDNQSGAAQLHEQAADSKRKKAPAEDGTAPVEIAGLPNFRDVGGKQAAGGWFASGKVFRSEQLIGVKDIEEIEALGVEEIIDFRGAPEFTDAPDPEIASAKRVSLPIFDADKPDEDIGVQLGKKLDALGAAKQSGDADEMAAVRADLDAWSETLEKQMASSYELMVSDARVQKQFRTYLEHVAAGTIVSFHCVSGKDRTGLAAALLLRGVGVPWATVRADYLLSNDRLAEDIEKKLEAIGRMWTEEPGHASPTRLRSILGVDEAYLNAAFAKIQEEYGAGMPPKNGEIASDGAIAALYEKAFGKGLQARLKKQLIEE